MEWNTWVRHNYDQGFETAYYKMDFGEAGDRGAIDGKYKWMVQELVTACMVKGSALMVGQHLVKRQECGVNVFPVASETQAGYVTGYVGFIGEQPVKVGVDDYCEPKLML